MELLFAFVFFVVLVLLALSKQRRQAEEHHKAVQAAFFGEREKPKKQFPWFWLGMLCIAFVCTNAAPADRLDFIGFLFLLWAAVRFMQCIVALVQDVPVRDPKGLTDFSGVIIVTGFIYTCKDTFVLVFPALALWLAGRHLMRRVGRGPTLPLDALSPFILLAEAALYFVTQHPREATRAALAFGVWMIVLVAVRVRRSRTGVQRSRPRDNNARDDARHVVRPALGRPRNDGPAKFVDDLPQHVRQLFDEHGKG